MEISTDEGVGLQKVLGYPSVEITNHLCDNEVCVYVCVNRGRGGGGVVGWGEGGENKQ